MKTSIAVAVVGASVLVGTSLQVPEGVAKVDDTRQDRVDRSAPSARKAIGAKLHYRCETAYRPKIRRYKFRFKFRVPRSVKRGQTIRLRGINLKVSIRRAYARMGIRHNLGKLVLVPGMTHGWSDISVGSKGKRRMYDVNYRRGVLKPRWFKSNIMHFTAGDTRSRITMPRRGKVAILRAPRRFDLYGAWDKDSAEAFECYAPKRENRVLGMIRLR